MVAPPRCARKSKRAGGFPRPVKVWGRWRAKRDGGSNRRLLLPEQPRVPPAIPNRKLSPTQYFSGPGRLRSRAHDRNEKAAPIWSGLFNSNLQPDQLVAPPGGGSAIGSCACFTAPSKIAFGSIASEAWKMSPRTFAPEQS